MFGLGMQELLVILLVVLLLFGAKRIPEVMRSFGKGVTEFKRGVRELESEVDKTPDEKAAGREDREDVEDKKA
jgi:sec-independent protein translocase protein TatA